MAHQDMEISAKVNGIAVQLEKFDFLFGVMLGEKLLRLAHNLSYTLQQKDLSAAEGNQAAHLTRETLLLFVVIQNLSNFGIRLMPNGER